MFGHPPQPNHIAGVPKGEELVQKARESGRRSRWSRAYRTARDATSINPGKHGPVLPVMPHLPPQ